MPMIEILSEAETTHVTMTSSAAAHAAAHSTAEK